MKDNQEDNNLSGQLDRLAGLIDIGDTTEARQEAGAFGESIAAIYATELADGELVSQHAEGDAPQGIDTTYLDSLGNLHAAESKTIGYSDWHQSSTSRTVDGRQMDQQWIADRLGAIDVAADPEDIGPGADQVRADLFQIDIPRDTFATYEVGPTGQRTENYPNEIWSLSDLVEIGDGQSDEDSEVSTDAGE